MKGVLYIVSTPIGNLEDITERAKRILCEVELVLAEDTRRTRILLARLGLKKKLISFYRPKEKEKIPYVISQLEKGKAVALVSDAGTPLISDPGFLLIKEAAQKGIKIVPVPGPSAVLCALVASGISPYPFSFWGFVPKKDKRTFFESLKERKETLVFFESPERIINTLSVMRDVFGERMVCVAREMTKVHEEFIRGSLSDVLNVLVEREKVVGEITLVVEGCKEEKRENWQNLTLKLVNAGYSKKDVAKIVSILTNVSRNEVYRWLMKRGS